MRDFRNIAGTISNSGPPSGVTGVILNHNEKRASFYIQNVHTGSVLYVKFGAGASNDNFNLFLKPATVAIDNYDGGTFYSNDWVGPVSVSGLFSRYVAWEMY